MPRISRHKNFEGQHRLSPTCEPSTCSGCTETEQHLTGVHKHHEAPHGWMPSPDKQNTCWLILQTPMNPQAPCGGYRASPVFHDQDKICNFPLEGCGCWWVWLLGAWASAVPWRRPSKCDPTVAGTHSPFWKRSITTRTHAVDGGESSRYV